MKIVSVILYCTENNMKNLKFVFDEVTYGVLKVKNSLFKNII